MKMEIRLAQVDEDLVVRLPSDVVRDLDLHAGERMTVHRFGEGIAVRRANVPSLEEMLRTVKEPEGELDSGPAVGREIIE